MHIKRLENKSAFIGFIFLAIVLGFPRLYGTEIPIALLLAPFFFKSFLLKVAEEKILYKNIFITFVLLCITGLTAFTFGHGLSADFFFLVVVCGKLLLTVYYGPLVANCISKSNRALFIWLYFQMAILILSILDSSVYLALLGFISPRSADVFVNIVDLRAIGLGLYHVDGSITLVAAAFLTALYFKRSFVLPIVFFAAAAVARTGIIAFLILSLLTRGLLVKAIFVFIILSTFILVQFVDSGPIGESLEIFRTLYNTGYAQSNSVDHLSTMFTLPALPETYFLGDGLFFNCSGEDLEFYMGTDVGYLRLLYFGGVLFALLFILLNIMPALYMIKRYPFDNPIVRYVVALSVIFLVVNSKGLQMVPIFIFAGPFLIRKYRV